MIAKLNKTLEAVWYAAGPAQYLLYGIWTVVISGMFSLNGPLAILPFVWKINGVMIVISTIWCSMKVKQYVILANTMIALMIGAAYSSHAVMIGLGVEGINPDLLRSSTQSLYLSLLLLIVWGFYLANLVARQRWEFNRVGVKE